MPLNINQIFSQMLSAAKTELGDGWKKGQSVAEGFINSNKERLVLLAELIASGELDEEGIRMRLKNELLLLEAQLNALKIVSLATVQKTVNAMIEVLVKAAGTVLPGGFPL